MNGHIRKRGKNSYQVFVELPREPGGRRRQKTFTVRGRKKDAEQKLAATLHEINTGLYIEPAKLTVGEYLDRWLTTYPTRVSRKTCDRYAEIVRIHLKPALGLVDLPRLQSMQIQEYYGKALKEGRRDGNGGLSAQTVLHHHRVLRKALQDAVRWNLMARNPADGVEPPRPARREMLALNDDQMVLLLDAAKESRLYVVVLLAATTGLRRGEILALCWKDIDLEKGVLQVRRTLEQARGGLRFKEPKTAKGRRLVDLPDLTVEALLNHRAQQAKERLMVGPGYDSQDLVCARIHGTPLDPAETTAAFARLIRRLDLPAIRLHDLRHSHATALLRQGTHPKIVSERLGHSTVAITLDTYSHVLPGMQKEAAQQVDRALRAAKAKQNKASGE
jgi:integrase